MEPHLYLRDTGESVPGRWGQAFPQGAELDTTALEQRLRSHSLAHAIVWTSATGALPWMDRVQRLLALQAELKIVLLSGVPSEQEGLQAIQAGVRGYAHSHSVPALLQEVALVVQHGGLWLGPDLMRRLVQATAEALVRQVAANSALAKPEPPRKKTAQEKAVLTTPEPPVSGEVVGMASANVAWAQLTARERQIAHSVASGRSNKEIAAQMRISEKTVKAHLGAVFQKLGVRDRLQLVVRMAAIDASGDV